MFPVRAVPAWNLWRRVMASRARTPQKQHKPWLVGFLSLCPRRVFRLVSNAPIPRSGGALRDGLQKATKNTMRAAECSPHATNPEEKASPCLRECAARSPPRACRSSDDPSPAQRFLRAPSGHAPPEWARGRGARHMHEARRSHRCDAPTHEQPGFNNVV